MSSTVFFRFKRRAGDEEFLPPIPAEVVAARAALGLLPLRAAHADRPRAARRRVGARWRATLAQALADMSFASCQFADPDAWH